MFWMNRSGLLRRLHPSLITQHFSSRSRGSLVQKLLHTIVVLMSSAVDFLTGSRLLNQEQVHQRKLIEIEWSHWSIPAYWEVIVPQWQQSMKIMALSRRRSPKTHQRQRSRLTVWTKRVILSMDRSSMTNSIRRCLASSFSIVCAWFSPRLNIEMDSDASTMTHWMSVHRSNLFSISSSIIVYEGCRIKIAGGTKF